jgi:hypothetical protein
MTDANGPFHNSDLTRIREMVLVNVLALTELTRLLLPGMVSRRRGTGVTVTVICPGATATNFSQTAQAKNTPLFSLTPVMSSPAVARTGYLCMKAGRTVVVTGLIDKLLRLGGRYMPRFMSLPISDFLMRSK